MPEPFTLHCINCNKTLPAGTFAYQCPVCVGQQMPDAPPIGVLKTLYPFEEIREQKGTEGLFGKLKENLYLDILPIRDVKSTGPLRVGETPMYSFTTKRHKGSPLTYHLKDDSQNPTFSFKDRASQLVSAYALEQGLTTLVAASTGNAGSSLAGISASQNQKAIIIVPKTAPPAKLLQIIMYGATLVMVDGNYDAAFDLSLEATRRFGWFNRNTGYNPFTIEGKKTVAFEIFDQLQGMLPSRIFVPVGDGVIIAGVYKGFEDLLHLGIINKMPVIVAVQSTQSDNLVRNMGKDEFTMKPATTMADSISVDYPRNFYMASDYLGQYGGECITVTDKEIMQAAGRLARETGIFAEPAAAAAMAGMLKFAGETPADNENPMLVLSTGSGLKDIHTPMKQITLPNPIKPDLSSLEKYLSER